jgi:hypothetical protein
MQNAQGHTAMTQGTKGLGSILITSPRGHILIEAHFRVKRLEDRVAAEK